MGPSPPPVVGLDAGVDVEARSWVEWAADWTVWQAVVWSVFVAMAVGPLVGFLPASWKLSSRGALALMVASWLASRGPVIVLLGAGMMGAQLVQLYLKQESVLYHPSMPGLPGLRKPSDFPLFLRMHAPTSRGLPFEDVRPVASDGTRLHAWMVWADPQCSGKFDADAARRCPTIVFFHGNAGCMCMRLPNVEAMYLGLHRRVNVYMAEYRGYGESEGTPSEAGLDQDAIAHLNAVTSGALGARLDRRLVFVFGRSLGGAGLGGLMGSDAWEGGGGAPGAAGMVLENTFTSAFAMAQRLFPSLAPFLPFMLRLRYDTLSAVRRTRIPAMFVSGLQDEVVPPPMMQELFEAHPGPSKRIVHIPDGDHNRTWERGGNKYMLAFNAFLATTAIARLENESLRTFAPPETAGQEDAVADDIAAIAVLLSH